MKRMICAAALCGAVFGVSNSSSIRVEWRTKIDHRSATGQVQTVPQLSIFPDGKVRAFIQLDSGSDALPDRLILHTLSKAGAITRSVPLGTQQYPAQVARRGIVDSSGRLTLVSQIGEVDVWSAQIERFMPDGERKWRLLTIPTTAVAADEFGTAYMAYGNALSSLYLRKIGPDGTTKWLKNYFRFGIDLLGQGYPFAVAPQPDGSVIALVQLLGFDHNPIPQLHIWHVSSSGAEISRISGDLFPNEDFDKVVPLSNGNYLIRTYSNGYRLRMLDKLGRTTWLRDIGNRSEMVVDKQSRIWLMTYDATGMGVVMQLDATGNLKWSRTLPDQASGLIVDSRGEGYVVTSGYEREPALWRFAPNGALRTQFGLDEPGLEAHPGTIALDEKSGNIVVGSATNAGTTLTRISQAPWVSNDRFTVPKNQMSLPGSLMANDLYTQSAQIEIVKPPAHGSIPYLQGDSFVYSPTPGYSGPDTFTYRLNRGTLRSFVATVSLTVQ